MSTTIIEKPRRDGTPFDQLVRVQTPVKRPVIERAPVQLPVTIRQPRRGPRPEAPTRTYLQRMRALQLANEMRSRRAQLKRDLKAGRETFTALLLNPPAYVETAKVFDLMLAVPKYGRVKTNKILSGCRISPSKTIGGLSERQRLELVNRMRRG